jgi:inhibitor of cysteine peptidase
MRPTDPIGLGVGERVTIRLDANPTTGHRWDPIDPPDAAVVRIVGDGFTGAAADRVGAGGSQEIVVEGVAPGRTELRLGYTRPWEDGVAPAATATFDISVS